MQALDLLLAMHLSVRAWMLALLRQLHRFSPKEEGSFRKRLEPFHMIMCGATGRLMPPPCTGPCSYNQLQYLDHPSVLVLTALQPYL
jgi:hypothetical protein